MPRYKVTWKESGKVEEIDSDCAIAAEYKATRFGTPASEVTIEEIVAEKPVAKKTVK